VLEAVATRDHTEIALQALGAEVQRRPGVVEITGPVAALAPLGKIGIPGDPSSAAFFLCAAAMVPDAHVVLEEVSLNPTRSALLDLLSGMGADISVVSLTERQGELVGSLRAGGFRQDALGRRPQRLRGDASPGLRLWL